MAIRVSIKAKPCHFMTLGGQGRAGPPTMQPLCPVHRGLILILQCFPSVSVPVPPSPPIPCGTPRYGLLVSKEVALRGVEPNDNQAQKAWQCTSTQLWQENNSTAKLKWWLSSPPTPESELLVANTKLKQTPALYCLLSQHFNHI